MTDWTTCVDRLQRSAALPTRGEEQWPTARPPGRDYQGRHPALRRPVRHRCGEVFGRVAPDASRYPGGAQAPFRRHVPEDIPSVWRLAGGMDAVAGSLRPKEGRAKQEGHGTRCADRTLEFPARRLNPALPRVTIRFV